MATAPIVVVIGASAGALEAVSAILSALPADFAPAVAVVIHLPARQPSLLRQIFARRCALPVCEVDDKQPLVGATVYVAPPDYHLLLERERFALSRDEAVHFSRPSIDVLFESAAAVYGRRVLGVLLTGASADGAAGLRAIADAGGTTAVEDPETAYASVMPRAGLTLMQPRRPDIVGDPPAIGAWVRAASQQWERA